MNFFPACFPPPCSFFLSQNRLHSHPSTLSRWIVNQSQVHQGVSRLHFVLSFPLSLLCRLSIVSDTKHFFSTPSPSPPHPIWLCYAILLYSVRGLKDGENTGQNVDERGRTRAKLNITYSRIHLQQDIRLLLESLSSLESYLNFYAVVPWLIVLPRVRQGKLSIRTG